MITGCVYVDLAHEPSDDDPNADRRKLMDLEWVPAGARVIVDIGRRSYVSCAVAAMLHAQDARLLIEIRGQDAGAVLRVVSAARAGEWSVL